MINSYQKIYLEWLVDVLAYVVVLNLLAEHFNAYYIYSFTVSVMLALSMKLILVPIAYIKAKIGIFWNKKGGWPFRVLGILSKFVILFSSKFVVLAYLDFKYRDYVSIESFISITALILLLMLTGKLLRQGYDYLGIVNPVNNL